MFQFGDQGQQLDDERNGERTWHYGPRVTLRLTLTTFSLIAVLRAQGATLFVNGDLTKGTNNGYDWSDAYQGPHGLQAALATALPGDEVWVARGTYLPTDDGDRDVSFNLGPNIGLLGGFVGNESASVERDPVSNTTGAVALALLTACSAVTVLLVVLSYTTFPVANMFEQLGHWGAVLCWRGTFHLVDVIAADDRNMLTADETKQWHMLIQGNPGRSTLGLFYRHNIVVLALNGQPQVRHRRIDIPLWALFVACSAYPFAALVRGRARRRKQRRRRLCEECWYDLTGNVSGICPECATPIASPVGHAETGRTE